MHICPRYLWVTWLSISLALVLSSCGAHEGKTAHLLHLYRRHRRHQARPRRHYVWGSPPIIRPSLLERFPVGYATYFHNGQTILWHPEA